MPEATERQVPVDDGLRRARVAVALLFFTNGALFANLLPEYPAIKSALQISNGEFGLAVAAFPAGALLSGLAAGVLVRRWRSSRVAVVGTVLTGAGVFAAGASSVWIALAASLLVAGAMDALTDVAQNAHGLRVQRRYGRSILNSFHAVWSLGAVTGGLMGAGAVAINMAPIAHLGISAVVFSSVSILAYRFLLPGPEGHERTPPADSADLSAEQQAPDRRQARAATRHRAVLLGALVVVAASGAVTEDAGNSWAALYLHDDLGAVASLAAFGYIALTGAQFIGRMIGDRMVDRFGQRAVARTGGLVAATGMGLALAFPSVAGTIAGFGVVGFGVATLVPAAMHGADSIPGLRPGTGLAVLSWLMRLGFLAAPPLVGFVADATSLRVGLLVVPLAGVLVVLCAGALSSRHERAESVVG